LELIENVIDIIFFGGRKKFLREVSERKNDIEKAYSEFALLDDPNYYLTKKSFTEWKNRWIILSKLLKAYSKHKKHVKTGLSNELEKLETVYQDPNFIKKRNRFYLKKELQKHQAYFESLEKYPLTQKQREAIIVDEYRNLVVAGAGTGKTSTLIGKAGYIQKKGIQSEHILLLSFGSDPRDEMNSRLKDLFGVSFDVNTFHGLGMKIIAEAHNEKPTISKLSTDSIKLRHFISNVIETKKQDTRFLRKMNRFFLSQTEYKSLWEFKTLGEYYTYLRENDVRSLKGDIVKSYEELEIANYLYTNGIDYEYEARYEHNTASKLYGQYTPDFYLPEYGIYIEHFGIDENRNTAPCVPRQKYLQEMDWKRQTHKKYETKLIETYSYEKRQNKLLENLKKKLESEGVKFKQITEEELFAQLNNLGYVQPITNLLSTFLNLYKSSNTNIPTLKQKSYILPDTEKSHAFLEIFEPIYEEYNRYLVENDEIDFNDMINKAIHYIKTREVKIEYKYILVDEFQDISQSRARLLNALLNQNPESKLFCVGDDWQSIYRFTGSDLNIMTNFEENFGHSEILFLDETFRFNNEICEFSTKFILKNPHQISKQLKTRDHVKNPAISIIFSNDTIFEINTILNELNQKGGTVFIIGRYRYQEPQIIFDYPNLSIKYLTAHKSKGTQADYVITIGLDSGKMGFPCEISDDPLLNLVLSKQDKFPHSEERRLFYVAVTRAKKHVFLISNPSSPSTFINEICEEDYSVNLNQIKKVNYGICPRCNTGELLLRNGQYGDFYSCSNYPYCSYRPIRCPKCGSGYLLNQGEEYLCTKCNHRATPCPDCEGVEIERNGRYGRFYGCSNYPECTHTRDISD